MTRKPASTPSGDTGIKTEPVTACRCGAGPHPELADRCAAGHVLRANQLATITGARSVLFWEAHEEARLELQRAVVEDAGFTLEDAPKALLLAGDSIAQATLIRDSAFQRMCNSGGPLTSSGRERRAFTVWCSALDRVERHLRLVGLQRKAATGPTLVEYIKGRSAQAADEKGDADA